MKRAVLVALVAGALAAPAAAEAGWSSRAWNLSWPRQGYARNVALDLPATRYRVRVSLDSNWLSSNGSWNYLACGTGTVRSSRARYGVQYESARTRVVLTLKSGWLCGEFPGAGDRSQVLVWYWR
jgi:hypothetical protein